MTNDFKTKRNSLVKSPRLSPEEYKEKKKAEKAAVYQMLDDTALEVVQSPEKFRGYLDVQSRMDRYTANNALLMYKQFPQASQVKEFDDWVSEDVKINKGAKTFIILDPYEYTKKDGTIGIDFNLKRVLDVSQTNGRRPAAPAADRDPRKLVAVMLDTAPIEVESVDELPYPNMGAFYKKELGHAELSMNSETYSRRDMGFWAVCIGYMRFAKSTAWIRRRPVLGHFSSMLLLGVCFICTMKRRRGEQNFAMVMECSEPVRLRTRRTKTFSS